MKNKLVFIIPAVLVVLVILGVVIFLVLQNANKQNNTQSGNPTITTSANQTDENNSNDTSDGGNTVASDVCNVLTLEIAKTIIGNDAKLASQNTGNCTYSSTSEDFSSFGILTMVISKSDIVSARAQFEQAKSSVYQGKTEAVDGINVDGAYYATTMMQLSMLKGDSWIIISGVSEKFESEKELAIATAKLIYK